MTLAYLDTSAAAKLLIEEPESAALAEWADDASVELVATLLLETELRRLAVRRDVPQMAVSSILDGVSLYEPSASLYREAGILPGATLRSLDALHLAGALRLGVDAMATYDDRLADAARSIGLAVVAPS
ncbi:type II toxin-antitoxin system VapC family toxin [Agrococcus sp. TSP3-2-1]|uniref:type II toxin-antitoxin system VapC family toxin n=1 Tax=Agrococcus sp. TSP3-2-1 TaxID=2804583 RepID=UPI003CEE6254